MPQESNQTPDQVQNAAKAGQTRDPKTPDAKDIVKSTTPENALGHLNPSAPEDANVTPGSATVK